jgi:hypothetical protein
LYFFRSITARFLAAAAVALACTNARDVLAMILAPVCLFVIVHAHVYHDALNLWITFFSLLITFFFSLWITFSKKIFFSRKNQLSQSYIIPIFSRSIFFANSKNGSFEKSKNNRLLITFFFSLWITFL